LTFPKEKPIIHVKEAHIGSYSEVPFGFSSPIVFAEAGPVSALDHDPEPKLGRCLAGVND